MPPVFDFFPKEEFCQNDKTRLNVFKTDTRTKKTMQMGRFKARETIKVCPKCGIHYRSKELSRIVPPSCNFGYDILVFVGKSLFLDHLADHTIVEQLLMSGLDSIMKIVLSNCKLLSEKSDSIIPFLEDIKELFGEPLALVHDMSTGIIKAVGKVFPNVLDFICHFHFLRDIGKDLLGVEYDNIRKRLTKHKVTGKLNYRLRRFIQTVDENMQLIDMLNDQKSTCCGELLSHMPVIAAYSLIVWAFEGKNQGNGYGFPFDRPHLEFAKRLKVIYADLNHLRKVKLRRNCRDNKPLDKTFLDLSDVIKDKSLWKSVDKIESEIVIFDKLRDAMRIAPKTGKKGLNNEGSVARISTIEKGVKNFRKDILSAKGYSKNKQHKKMIEQIDKYWEKLFADPIKVESVDGKKYIQPQMTNNYAEQNFRDLKRGYRRKTGNGSLWKTLRTMLANTPLVKNLKNSEYMKTLLNGKSSIEELFAEIDATEVLNELKTSQGNIEKIPTKLKKLTKKSDYP